MRLGPIDDGNALGHGRNACDGSAEIGQLKNRRKIPLEPAGDLRDSRVISYALWCPWVATAVRHRKFEVNGISDLQFCSWS